MALLTSVRHSFSNHPHPLHHACTPFSLEDKGLKESEWQSGPPHPYVPHVQALSLCPNTSHLAQKNAPCQLTATQK